MRLKRIRQQLIRKSLSIEINIHFQFRLCFHLGQVARVSYDIFNSHNAQDAINVSDTEAITTPRITLRRIASPHKRSERKSLQKL